MFFPKTLNPRPPIQSQNQKPETHISSSSSPKTSFRLPQNPKPTSSYLIDQSQNQTYRRPVPKPLFVFPKTLISEISLPQNPNLCLELPAALRSDRHRRRRRSC